MFRRSWLGLILTAWLATAAGAGPTLPRMSDLRALAAEAGRSGQPVIVLFSTPGCPHCEQVRASYLAPRLAAGALVREVDITARRLLVDATGRSVSEAELARQFGVRAVPAVFLLDGRGQPAAEPLLGSDTAGFYEGYLESRLAQARARMAPPPR